MNEGGIAPPSTISSLHHHHHRRANSTPTTPIPSEKKTTSDQVDKGDRAFFNSPQQQQNRLLLYRNSSVVVPKRRIIVESPRLRESDAILFPASKHGPLRNSDYLQSYEARYQYIQQQQQQQCSAAAVINNNDNHDMTVLRIDYRLIHMRQISPQALQYGILPQCAVLIQTLYIPLLTRSSSSSNSHNNNHNPSTTARHQQQQQQQQQQLRKMLKSIVAWMDVLSRRFPNLKHIYLQPTPLSSSRPVRDNNDDKTAVPTTTTTTTAASAVTLEEVQLWRRYVVHRLPTLESIDGVTITTNERNESKSLFHPGTTSQQQRQKSSPDMRRNSDGDHSSSISCYTHQARAKLLAGHPFLGTTTTAKKKMSLPPKTKKTVPKKSRRNVNDGLEPVKYCLLDNLVDDDDDDDDVEPNDDHVNENDKPGHNKVTSSNRRIILALDDFAVEVKQPPSPETPFLKSSSSRAVAMHRTSDLVPPTAGSRQNRPNVGHRHSTTTTTTVDSLSLPYNPSLSFEQDHHHQDWEYVSASGESSVHALNACAAWTTACGTLTSSLYNLRSMSSSSNIQNSNNHKSMNRSRPTSSQDKPSADLGHGGGVLSDLRMKTDHIKSKFHLLQQHRKMKKEFAQPTFLEPKDNAVVSSQMNGSQDLIRAPGTLMKHVDTLQVTTTYTDAAMNSDNKSFIATPQPPRGGATPTVDLTLRSANMFHVPYPLTQSRSSPTKLPSSSVTRIHNNATRSDSVLHPTPNVRLDHPQSQNNELPPPGPRRQRPPTLM